MGRVTVDNLGKAYKRYSRRWHRLAEWLVPGTVRHEPVWVLRNLSFQVAPGESVGVIGRNGAGKSTLLKLITGTAQPSEGTVSVSGRVAALLELGMGFHPDFTGRQNVRVSGQLLGISAEDIETRMPEIEAFAEIGTYIDEPVRTYSSGMQVRLAFSVATALRPDILIVDEALAVGDAYFQHKCFDRIRRFRREGTTLLFVSHDPGAVKLLCDRAVLLEGGRMIRDGDPNEVLEYYSALLSASDDIEPAPAQESVGRAGFRSGNRKAEILAVELNGRRAVDDLPIGAPLTITVRFRKSQAIEELALGLMIKDRLGNEVFGTNTYCLELDLDEIEVGDEAAFDFRIDSVNLGPGSYSVTVALHRAASHLAENFDWWDHAAVFQVQHEAGLPSFIGICRLPIHVERRETT